MRRYFCWSMGEGINCKRNNMLADKNGDDGNGYGTASAVIIVIRLALMLNVIARKQNVCLTFLFLSFISLS